MTKARTATIISAVSVLAVGGLTWQFVLSPRMAEADSINTQAMDVETQNVMLTGRYNEAVTRAQQAPEVAAEAQALFAQMPQSAELPAVLDQIMNAATDAGIDETDVASLSTGIPQLVPESEGGVSGVQLATMSISVSAEGSATSTMDFLDNLQSLDRALLVNQASRTPNTDTEVSADGEETNEGDESEESSTDESADDGETPISEEGSSGCSPGREPVDRRHDVRPGIPPAGPGRDRRRDARRPRPASPGRRRRYGQRYRPTTWRGTPKAQTRNSLSQPVGDGSPTIAYGRFGAHRADSPWSGSPVLSRNSRYGPTYRPSARQRCARQRPAQQR